MPVRNATPFLRACIDSIRNQSLTDWELIAIDDHSSDGSASQLSEFVVSDSRIKVFSNQGQGIIDALQTAFSHASGEFITRMDADDMMPESRLQLMQDALSPTNDRRIVTGYVKYISEKEVSAGYRRYESWINSRVDKEDHWQWIYRECVIASPNWMARRSDLESIHAFGELRYPEDYDLTFKWYLNKFKVITIDQTTLFWREHPDRTSRNSAHYSQESFFRLKLEYFILHELNAMTLLVWGTGDKGKLTARILKEHEINFKWMTLEPEKYTRIEGIEIEDFGLEKVKEEYKLLIAVYPSGKELHQLLTYLKVRRLTLGQDYWFL